MSLVDLGPVRMKMASTLHHGARAPEGKLSIRLTPIAPGAIPELPVGTTWAWAIVVETPGDSTPDALLAGGAADSQTAALAMAHKEFQRQEARIARELAARERG